jgi:hypothetical protein
VGQIVRALSASISVPPSRALVGVTLPPFVPSVLVGVGHIDTAPANVVPRFDLPAAMPSPRICTLS